MKKEDEFTFVEGKTVVITKDNCYTPKKFKEVRKAYGFFYCRASEEEIKAELLVHAEQQNTQT